MSTLPKRVVFFLSFFFVIAIVFFLVLAGRSAKPAVVPSSPEIVDETLPTPVVLKLDRTIKEVRADSILVTSPDGDMTIGKNPAQTKLFRRSGNKLMPLRLEMLHVGQKVSVNIVTPGEEVVLIIEP